ncbi:MAG: AAA domain-containing protein [Tissierellia bacterium]|nr:AAA domain-containing protein [Tissierellia bacterium]
MSQRISIDKNNQVILLYSNDRNDWEDKTDSISGIYKAYYYGNTSGYEVFFKGVNTLFFYKKNNVQILDKVKDVDISEFDVLINNKLEEATKVEEFQNKYYRIKTATEKFLSNKVIFESNKYKDIYEYYRKLAEYAGTVAETNTPLSFLSINYSRISSTLNDSVLKDFLRGKCKSVLCRKGTILPFDFNQSQLKAIEEAMSHNISVIEGPPGTGKTQTILNAIANVLYAGKNCAVISNNNAAINNVFEKLQEEKLGFIAASLGNSSNVQNFFQDNQQEDLLHFLEEIHTDLTNEEHSKAIKLVAIIKQIQELQVETSLLELELSELQYEKKHYDDFDDEELILRKKLKSKDYVEIINKSEIRPNFWWYLEKRFNIKSERIKKLLLKAEEQYYNKFIKKYLAIKFGVKIKTNEELSKILSQLKKLYYQERIAECNLNISQNKETIADLSKTDATKELQKLHRKLFEYHLYMHYNLYKPEDFTAQNYRNNYSNFLSRYPVILSTSQSLLNNTPRGFKFDYVIIDEASQGDLLSSALALYCSKNLVVVGDSRQLQQIDEERLFEESDKLAQQLDIPSSYRYSGNSILKSVKDTVKNVPVTLLKEHYRCAPDIINFCNKMFYNGELVAMTHNSDKHIEIIKTVEGNHARKNPFGTGLYNQREIDEIENLIKTSSSNKIGVISPFKYQAELINNKFSSQIEADTVHKFQGRQKDEVILSFVVNSLDQNQNEEKNRLYNFVTNPQLLNVAISRGRTKVTAIVADKVYKSTNNVISDFIKYAEYVYGSEITKESTIRSVFDTLYLENSNILAKKFKNHPNEYATELLMYELIKKILEDYNCIDFSMHARLATLVKVPDTFTEEEKRYILHPWTHVDFLFYNTVSKEALFALEVDGIQFHEQHIKQTERDRIKDKILKENGIEIYRFKTNQSNEKKVLKEILDKYKH